MKKFKNTATQNVFEDLGFSHEESRILSLKAQIAAMIVREADDRKLNQKQLSKLWGVPQPRVSEVLSGKLSLVSIERLIEFLAALGIEVSFRKVSTGGPRRKAG